MADFLWKDVICCHSCVEKLIIDKRSKNKKVVAEFVQRYRVKRVAMSVYHPQANEMMKHGHNQLLMLF